MHLLLIILLYAQRRFYACFVYLNYGDKFRLHHSILSSLPTFNLITLKVYRWDLTELIKIEGIAYGEGRVLRKRVHL
jgi:hypothetical protein